MSAKSEKIKSNRAAWIDWAKTLLIYFVVVGHAGCQGGIKDFIYAFHMPAFFIISGYLYRPHNWRRTFRSFAIPVLVFSIINLFFQIGFDFIKTGEVDWQRYALNSWKAYYSVAWGPEGFVTLFTGVWFIVVLMLCRFLLGDIKLFQSIHRYYKEIALLMVIWMFSEPFLFPSNKRTIQDLYFYRVLSCFPFMAFGIFMKEQAQERKGYDSVSKRGGDWD